MMKNQINSWGELRLDELFYAFRKAKADCFFDRSLSIAQEFVIYESRISENLNELLVILKLGGIDGVLHGNLGSFRLTSKKLGIKKKATQGNHDAHGFFSDPARAFQNLLELNDLTPEFRLISEFPVQMHILSALWINLVGHKFDKALSRSAYGSRLRRYRSEPGSSAGALGKYHIGAIGSFQPYIQPYRQWRSGGLKAIREELSADRPVIAITMDLASYYHRVDPAFMANPHFWNFAGIELTEWEKEFTRSFCEALSSWSDKAREKLMELGCNSQEVKVGGLPIGLSISRILSNALLIELDREIEQQLSPVYYGRYVDDIFIVLRDPGTIGGMPALLKFISARSKIFPAQLNESDGGEIWLSLGEKYRGKTTLLLQQSKQKVFFLQGAGGIDLLDSIESQIGSVSSERRLMPSPENLESMVSAKVLTAAGHASEEADTLRRADGLSVRRLGWAVMLRAVETLARDLRKDDWKSERDRFYKFALNHVLRPDKIFDHLDYLPRLLSLAVGLSDWADAKRLYDAAVKSLVEIKNASSGSGTKVNGFDAAEINDLRWEDIFYGVRRSAADAIVRSLRWSKRTGGPLSLSEVAISLCVSVELSGDEGWLHNLSRDIRETDWARVSYKDHIRGEAKRQKPFLEGEDALGDCYEHQWDLREFLKKSSHLSARRIHGHCVSAENLSILPYLFPTRPYSTQEVSLFLPNDCIFSEESNGGKETARNWARYIRAVKGVWVLESLVREDDFGDPLGDVVEGKASQKMAYLDSINKSDAIRLGISSLSTADETWRASASGGSDLSPERYRKIKAIVDQAVQASPRPTHLLFPELSLPERWLGTVSGLLRNSKISFIAGLDYTHIYPSKTIHGEAVLVLADDRLGFPAYVQIHQPKALPAPEEEQKLLRDFGKTWTPFFKDTGLQKPVYLHHGFAFGVLICSELQNMEHRKNFQGSIDCLMVLSWNRDLDTFSALVESASLDVHAYIALVNNRKYGDSRVRVPAKSSYDRDLCRLRGGENEHVVIVKIDVKKLRSFQSRNKRWPDADDDYKPVPEGFKIAKFRVDIPS